MKNTAWKDGDDEIYTHRPPNWGYWNKSKKEKYEIVVFSILLLVISVGFIIGQIIINNL